VDSPTLANPSGSLSPGESTIFGKLLGQYRVTYAGRLYRSESSTTKQGFEDLKVAVRKRITASTPNYLFLVKHPRSRLN